MAYIPTEEDEIRSVTRQQNRALRTMNRILRRRKEQLQEQADETIAALFDAPNEAEVALRILWEEGGFQPPCRPEDYDFIIDASIRALKEVASLNAAQGPAQAT